MVENPQKHIDFIKNPGDWPQFPYLPLFRKGNNDPIDREHGVVFAGHSLTEIKKVNLFLLPKTLQDFVKSEGWSYPSVEAMVEDGWEVD